MADFGKRIATAQKAHDAAASDVAASDVAASDVYTVHLIARFTVNLRISRAPRQVHCKFTYKASPSLYVYTYIHIVRFLPLLLLQRRAT